MIGKDSIESVLLYLKVLFKYTIMFLIYNVVETTRFTWMNMPSIHFIVFDGFWDISSVASVLYEIPIPRKLGDLSGPILHDQAHLLQLCIFLSPPLSS